MNRYVALLTSTLVSLLLVSCASTRSNPFPDADLSNETWQRSVDANPDAWLQGADSWFTNGTPNAAERQNRAAPESAVISTTMVHVANDFTKVQANGAFQVQIFGNYEHNTVYLYGPNEAVREMQVNVRRGTLSLQQVGKGTRDMRNVIVRIGMRNLTELKQLGCTASSCGSIEGSRVNSDGLIVTAAGKGNIYLSGNINLRQVTQAGSGKIAIFGARSSGLDINTSNSGSVNVSGNLALRSIVHHGTGDVNIIGAVSGCGFKINADGSGKVGVNGNRVNLQEVRANNNVHVYVTSIATNNLYVYTFKNACVGLSGYVNQAYMSATGSSHIFARDLLATDAFVRASDSAHINVTASNHMFASATNNGSIYFFGSPQNLSQFVSGNGVVIPIWTNNTNVSPVSRYKDSGSTRMHGYGYYHGQGYSQQMTPGY